MSLLEYFNGSSWIALSVLNNITLTGAVTGSGGSTIATTLNNTQTIASSLFSINWTNATASSKIITHYLLDSSPLASSIPQFVNTVQVGTGGSGGSATQRSWSLYYIPGYASTPVGANFTISYYHNTGFERFPLTINCTGIGDFDFSTTLYGKLIVNGTLDLGLNKLIGLATPTNLTDGVNKSYADSLITTQLSALSTLSTTGLMVRTGTNTFATRTLTQSTGISITNGDGVSGNPAFSVSDVPISSLSGYPSNSSLYLNGLGSWVNPLGSLSITTDTISSTTNEINFADIVYMNSNPIHLTTTANYGILYNSSLSFTEFRGFSGFTWKIGTAGATEIMRLTSTGVDLLSNNLTTTGNLSITGTTGFLTARKIRGSSTNASITSSSNIILSAGCTLTVTSGSGISPTFNYGYLNPSGSTGTATSTTAISYSIDAGSRIVASEFNARSSKNIKDIHSRDEAIEDEVLDIFKKISFTKYSYKDPYTNGFGNYYGVIAEELREVLPNYVVDNKNYLPNILCFFDIKKAKEGYYLNNNNFDLNALYSDISSVKLQLVGQENIHIDARIEDNSFFILKENIDELDLDLFELKNIFVFGTYGDCPTVCKTRLSDFSMVVLKNVIKRLETLESKI